MDITKLSKLVFCDLDNLSDEQVIKLHSILDKKVSQDSYDVFVDYNIKDSNLITKIDKKLNFIQVALSVAHVSKSNTNSIMGTVQPWDNMAYDFLNKKNIIIPPSVQGIKIEYIGGYVKQPYIGRSRWVVSIDLKSLYPSIIMMLNMSPETLVMTCKTNPEKIVEQMIEMSFDTSRAHKNNLAIAANGTMYSKEITGVLPSLMRYLFDTRSAIKKEMIRLSKELQLNKNDGNLKNEVARLDVLQYTYKILANSGYGAIGNNNFRYYNEKIAEGITATGQLAVRFIERKLNIFLNELLNTSDIDYVIAMDTDSCYFTLSDWVEKNLSTDDKNTIVTEIDNFIKNTIDPLLKEWYLQLEEYLNAYENRLIMEREAIADEAIWRAKKNYIINVWDMEGTRYTEPYLKMLGIETKRSSTPQIVRNKLTECLKLVINNDVKKLKTTYKEFKDEYNAMKSSDIAYPRGVKNIEKWLSPTNQPITGTPKHVKAAITYNNYIKTNESWSKTYDYITSGNKIKFVDLIPDNPTGSTVIAFPEDLPVDFKLEKYIDRKTMFEKMFMSPLESFTSITDIQIRRSNSFSQLSNNSTTNNSTLTANEKITTEKTKTKTRRARF